MDEENLPADWAIEEALRRVKDAVLPKKLSPNLWGLNNVKKDIADGWAQSIILAARLIETHEQAPVDPDVRLVADIINAFERESWVVQDTVMTVDYRRESLMNAVAVYKAHRAKETARG